MQKKLYIIRDKQGDYINPIQGNNSWGYRKYTGLTTGFTWYSDKSTVLQEMIILNDLGNDFVLEAIDCIKSIPSGILVT